MEENVIVLKYNQQTSNTEDLFVSFPNDDEVAYCRENDKSIFVINGTDMSKALNEIILINDGLFNGKFPLISNEARELVEEKIIPVQAKRIVSTGQLIFKV